MARPSLYEVKIKPYLDEIRELMGQGVPKAQIAKRYGISESTLYKYQREIDDVAEIASKGREPAVEQLEKSAFQSAMGHCVTVQKGMKCVVKKYDDNGKLKEVREIVEPYTETVYTPPNSAVLIFLLKNWGGYKNDPDATKLRREELELKKEVAKANNFDLDV